MIKSEHNIDWQSIADKYGRANIKALINQYYYMFDPPTTIEEMSELFGVPEVAIKVKMIELDFPLREEEGL